QLLHHGLDARPFDADAGAHRIDVGVAAGDRDLAARARLASDADDLDDALVDLGHLRLEQLLHQVRIGAAEDDHRAARLAVDVLHVGHHAVAGSIGLPGRLLARGQDPLGASEVDDDVVALLEAAHDAADQLPLAVLELVEDDVALGVADALQEHLLGRLRGDAPEGAAGLLHVEHGAELLVLLARALRVAGMPEHLKAELLADLGVEAVLARHLERDLPLRVFDLLDDGHVLEQIDVAVVFVEPRLELTRWPERRLGSLENRSLHRFDEDLLFDALFLGDLLDDASEIDVEASCCHGSPVALRCVALRPPSLRSAAPCLPASSARLTGSRCRRAPIEHEPAMFDGGEINEDLAAFSLDHDATVVIQTMKRSQEDPLTVHGLS